MRVLFIAGWFPDGKSYNGVFIKEHALAVAKKHRVAVIYGKKNLKQKAQFQFNLGMEDGLRVLRFRYRWVPPVSPYQYYVKGVVHAFETLLKEGFRPDIIHACVYHTGIPANVIEKKYGIPYVIREGYSGFMRKSMQRINVRRARKGMENAACILPLSNAQEKAIRSYGIQGRFEVVPNTVPDIFHYAPEAKKPPGVKKILCVASMSPKKNIPLLIRACKMIYQNRRDFRLDIVGTGRKIREYKKLAGRLSLGETIFFLGSRPKSEIARMMQDSDFFVLPSKYEPFGAVFIEALSCGLPVVATEVGGIPEIIDGSNGILVPSDNPEALSGAMNRMLDNCGNYDRKSISLNALKKYSYDTVGEQLSVIYERVLSSRHS